MKFIKKHYPLIIMLVIVFNVAAVGTTIAYFTSKSDEKINNFTAGQVSIDTIEENWTSQNKVISPNEELAKDPKVRNVGEVDAYVFLEVLVPTRNIKRVQDNKKTVVSNDEDLFTFDPNNNWLLITIEHLEGYNKHVYAYKRELKVGQTTEPLFEKIKFANVLEGELIAGEELTIDVTGVALQSKGLELIGETEKDKLANAYVLLLSESNNQ